MRSSRNTGFAPSANNPTIQLLYHFSVCQTITKHVIFFPGKLVCFSKLVFLQASNTLPQGLAELAPPSDPLLMSTKSMQHVSHLDDNTGLNVSDGYAACAHDSEATSGLTLAHSTGPSSRIKRTFCANDAPCTACS